MTSLDESLAEAGVSTSSRAALSDLATGHQGRLVILRAEPGLDAASIAEAVALASLHSDETKRLDVHLAVPAADRWSIDEVDSLVIAPAKMRPFERAHVVVADADLMAQAAHDHLLKTVEEPSSDATFWFCVSPRSALPATIRGRAAHDVIVHADPLETLAGKLAAATGLDEEGALEVLTAAGGDIVIARACVSADRLDALTVVGTGSHQTDAPTRTADELLLSAANIALARAAQVAVDQGGRKRKVAAAPTQRGQLSRLDAKKLTPADRATMRRLLRAVLDRWTADLVRQVREATTRAALGRAEERLKAVDEARAGMAMNTPLGTVFATVLAKLNA